MQDERLFGGTTINPCWAKTHLPGLRRPWCLLTVCLAALGLLLAFLGPAAAGDGALDPTFNNFGAGVQKIPYVYGQADYLSTSGSANGISLIYGYFTQVTDNTVNPHQTYDINAIAKLNNFAGTVDTTFNIPITGEVRTVYLTNNTSTTAPIIIGGQFSATDIANTKTYYNLARLYWTGTKYDVDITFPQVFNQSGAVNGIAMQQSNGYTLVGGCNLQVQGDTTHAYHLIRLLSNWNWDSSYSTNNPARALPGGYVYGFYIYPSTDGTYPNDVRIFGTLPRSSTDPAGSGNDYIQQLSSDLSVMVMRLGDGQVDGAIFSIAPSGSLWVMVGQFKHAFSTTYTLNGVARLKADWSGLDSTATGSFNDTINKLGGADHAVTQIVGGSNVVLGGNFYSFNGVACGHIVRLDPNGNVDPSFNVVGTGNGSGLDDRVKKMYQLSGSTNIQVTGAFRSYNSTLTTPNLRGGIATLSSNGVLQANYANVATVSTTPGTVYAMEWDQSGVLIGGDFTGVNGKWHQNLARLNWDGSVDPAFLHNVDGVVTYLRQAWIDSTHNDMLVAGNFGAADGVGCTSLARYNMNNIIINTGPYYYPSTTYSLVYSFKPAVTKADGTLGTVKMAEANDNSPHNIMVGGNFDKVNGTGGLNSVALLTSTGALASGFTFTPPQGLTNIRVNAGGSMGTAYAMVGKATYSGDGLTRGFVWQLTSTGALDQSFAIGQSPVPNVALFDDEVINGGGPHSDGPGPFFLCGKFTHVSDLQGFNIPRGYIAKFNANGTLDTTWAPVGANGPINAVDVQKNGKMIIGGAFSQYNSTLRSEVARLNADGSLDSSFDPGSGASVGPVYMVNWDDWNGVAFIGGSFTTYNGAGAPGFVRILAGPKIRGGGIAGFLPLLLDN